MLSIRCRLGRADWIDAHGSLAACPHLCSPPPPPRAATAVIAVPLQALQTCAASLQPGGNTYASHEHNAEQLAASTFPALLALVTKFVLAGDSTRLGSFLSGSPEASSFRFLSWLAELEAVARGQDKVILGAVCSRLVQHREHRDIKSLDDLYARTLQQLPAPGAAGKDALDAVNPTSLEANHVAYAEQLALRLTGHAPDKQGYSPLYNLLLQAADPATLTPSGVQRGHELAKELAVELRAGRKRSVTALIGRISVSGSEAAMLAAPPASRILDMLIQLSEPDRLACLADCFTPPSSTEGATAAASEDADLVWCTPAQMVVEIEARMRAMVDHRRSPGEPLKLLATTAQDGQLAASFSLGELAVLKAAALSYIH